MSISNNLMWNSLAIICNQSESGFIITPAHQSGSGSENVLSYREDSVGPGGGSESCPNVVDPTQRYSNSTAAARSVGCNTWPTFTPEPSYPWTHRRAWHSRCRCLLVTNTLVGMIVQAFSKVRLAIASCNLAQAPRNAHSRILAHESRLRKKSPRSAIMSESVRFRRSALPGGTAPEIVFVEERVIISVQKRCDTK